MTYISVFDDRALAPTPIQRRIPPTPVVRLVRPEPAPERADGPPPPSAPPMAVARPPYRVPSRAKNAGDQVVIDVCMELAADYDEIMGARRFHRLLAPRVEIAKRLDAIGYGLSEIGRVLGGKDHTSIFHYLGRKHK